jgi:hypothetical protein
MEIYTPTECTWKDDRAAALPCAWAVVTMLAFGGCRAQELEPQELEPVDARYVSSSTLAISDRGLFFIARETGSSSDTLLHRALDGGETRVLADLGSRIGYPRLALTSSRIVWVEGNRLMSGELESLPDFEASVVFESNKSLVGLAATERNVYTTRLPLLEGSELLEIDFTSGSPNIIAAAPAPALDLHVVGDDIYAGSCSSLWRLIASQSEAEILSEGNGCHLEIEVSERFIYTLDVQASGAVRRFPVDGGVPIEIAPQSHFVLYGSGMFTVQGGAIVELNSVGALVREVVGVAGSVAGMAHDGANLHWTERSADGLELHTISL